LIPSGDIESPRKSLIGRAESVRFIQNYPRASGNFITKQVPSIFHRKGMPNYCMQADAEEPSQ